MSELAIRNRINYYIAEAVNHYKENNGQFDEVHKINMARINGMVETLSMVTGKCYMVTEGGLIEA